jgi:uncharacterized protein (DUF58 family)
VSLLIVGSVLSSMLILLSASVLLLYLLLEGISFHRAIETAKDSIKHQSHPSRIETTVGRKVRIENVIANDSHSRFHIVGFSRNVPPQIEEEALPSPRLRLGSNGAQRIETSLKSKFPGNFELTASTILLEGRAGLFRQSLRIHDKVVIIVQPLVSGTVEPIETGVLTDLAVDHLRRGSGTDLAGIRPFNFLDDFRRIDWKATARTGKLMTRESYLERDPTIMLMIDVSSSMNTKRQQSCVLEGLLSEAGNLLTSIGPSSPMGLILYDKQRVIANIEARQGMNSRDRILRTLLERAKTASAPAPLERRALRSYVDLARETNALARESAFVAKTKAYRERFYSLASFVLPFYRRAESKYFERLRRQGAFKAFEIICTLREPVLVIVISDGETNLDGLVEGAKKARTANHKVVLAVLEVPEQAERIEILSDLEGQGMGVLRCRPEELSRAINAEILKLSHSRTIALEAAQ